MSNINKGSREKGFTLVELLAVIVILAIILVIAVPKIMNVINDSKKATLESTAKMIASSAEKALVQNTILGKTDKITCDSVAKLNDVDYESCSITFEDDTAKVTIAGSGKFKGLNVCGGDKTSAVATDEECPLVCKSNEVYVVEKFRNDPYVYEVGDSDRCISYLKNNVVELWPYLTEEEVTNMCTDETKTTDFDELISMLVAYDRVTEDDLIENNIIKSTVVENCVPTSPAACFDFDAETGTIVEYYQYENNDSNQSACPLDVVIPSKIDGVDVKILGVNMTGGGPGVYPGGFGITSVLIPEGIEEIGDYAFLSNDLSRVVLPSTLKLIGREAFRNNQISGELDLSNTKVTTIGRYAFYINQITKVKLPASITEIGSSALEIRTSSPASNPNLTTIINPSGKSFDWYNITIKGTSDTCTFVTGTCGSVTIKAS